MVRILVMILQSSTMVAVASSTGLADGFVL